MDALPTFSADGVPSVGMVAVHAYGPRISRTPSHVVESYRIGGLPIAEAAELEFVMTFEAGRVFASFGNGRWLPAAEGDDETFMLVQRGPVRERKKIEVLRSRKHVGRWIPEKGRHHVVTYQTPAALGLRAAFELAPHVEGDRWSFR